MEFLYNETHSFGHPTDYDNDKMRKEVDQESKLDVFYNIVTYIASRPEILTSGIRDLVCKLVLQDHRSNFGHSMLYYALSREHEMSLAAVHLLLECHSDPDASDHYGNGSMHILAYRYDGKNDEAFDSLLAYF